MASWVMRFAQKKGDATASQRRPLNPCGQISSEPLQNRLILPRPRALPPTRHEPRAHSHSPPRSRTPQSQIQSPKSKMPSSPAVNLVVLRARDLERAEAFYRALGFDFVRHAHGAGPEHLASESDGRV